MSSSAHRPRARRWLGAWCALTIAVSTGLFAIAPVAATEPTDMVLDWNQYAIEALANPVVPTAPATPGAFQPPPVAAIHLAMVHVAVFDAVNAIDRRYEAYLHGLPSVSRHASKAAAAATAAHDVLIGLVPALPAAVQTVVNDRYAASLAEISDGTNKNRGIAIGSAAAAAILLDRATDGRYGTFRFTAGTLPGEWRPELPAYVSDPNAWVARVRPFTLKSTSQFRTRGPLKMTSQAYVSEFNEVRAFGGATGSARTALQTETAQFFSINPMPMENRMLRDAAAERGLSTAQSARLFALSSLSASDALINCFDDKDHWSFWRPITAIREAANDGNPSTQPQADWLPFFATPPYPDHPSGFNCYTGAITQTAESYFRGHPVTISLTSPGTGTTRTYARFSDILYDTIDARIYMGLHFRTPDVQGADLGKRVARWVAGHFLERVDD